MSTIREHVKQMHPHMKMRRSDADLARDHANEHYRYSSNHYHAGPNRGPGERPRGWRTGEDARENSSKG